MLSPFLNGLLLHLTFESVCNSRPEAMQLKIALKRVLKKWLPIIYIHKIHNCFGSSQKAETQFFLGSGSGTDAELASYSLSKLVLVEYIRH